MIKKLTISFITLISIVVLISLAALLWLRTSNVPTRAGTVDKPIPLGVLDAPVTVRRDRYGVPYIHAQSLADAIRAQGFVTAQDRLTQMLLTREAVNGRLAERIGPRGESNDIRVRVLGIRQLARRFAAGLQSPSRELHEWYLEGVNAYIGTQAHEFPLTVRISGTPPAPYTLEDICAHYLLQAYDLTENWRSEWLAQRLVDRLGREKAAQISLVSVNPDDGSRWASDYALAPREPLVSMHEQPQTEASPVGGSNSWATAGWRSRRGAPILANDPHLDARRLPGIWYPVGLITPEWRAVGVAAAGWPGLAVGRSDSIAWGVTNSAADTADLFIERDDPENEGHYLEGELSLPYEVVSETLRVRDPDSPGGLRERTFQVRRSRRGPVVSDALIEDAHGRSLSLRWSVAENVGSQVGVDRLMLAKDVAEAGEAIRDIVGALNYNVVDTRGNIAHFTSGYVPVRLRGDGAIPLPVTDGEDNWTGFVPFEEAPSSINPQRGWVGNANHRTVSTNFDGMWSSYSAPSWRYRRMLELFDNERLFSAEDHWSAITDTGNTLARDLVPLFLPALETAPETQPAADVLSGWDYRDDAGKAAPALFQLMLRALVTRIFADELDTLVSSYEGSPYFWQERVYSMLESGESDWFDNINTPQTESRDDLVRCAALEAWRQLEASLGGNPRDWRWGDISRLRISSPLPTANRFVNRLFGGGDFPRTGSTETLWGSYGSPSYGAWAIDSLRFVADLGDPDKVLAVIPGGVSGRLFDPHLNDQLPLWLSGEINYWWFSDQAISANARREVTLAP